METLGWITIAIFSGIGAGIVVGTLLAVLEILIEGRN